MKYFAHFLIISAALIASLTCDKNSASVEPPDNKISVGVWQTTGDGLKKLAQQTETSFVSGAGSNSIQIDIDESVTYQQMEGFGAALTNSAAYIIFNSAKKDEVLQALFSPTAGIGISYVRLPMGASDFIAQPAYTYDDVTAGQLDMNLDAFSIEPDRAFILPVLKQAFALNPDLKIMASPWSAPAWMKSPSTLNGGALLQIFYQNYANYFVKFIEAYQAEGVAIDAVTVQNEPEHTSSDYPTMRMQAFEQAGFVRSYLGPAFANKQLQTKILVWDHNWDRANYPLSVLNDQGARFYVVGSAWHCYAGAPDAQSTVHNAHPDKDIYFTECSGGDWDADFASVLVWNFKNLFIGSVRHWAKTVLLWNLALDENHGPHTGGCNDCRGVVTISADGNVQYEVEYYVIGHLSKFVAPGAVRVASSTFENQIETVAFLNPDGAKVLIVLNPASQAKPFDVNWKDQHFSYNLSGKSVLTFKWHEQ